MTEIASDRVHVTVHLMQQTRSILLGTICGLCTAPTAASAPTWTHSPAK
jgi:hypothetical protein